MKYKIYLASGFNRRYELRKLAEKLQEKGHEITSRWIWLEDRPSRTRMTFPTFAVEIAKNNLEDLQNSNLLIIDAAGIRPDNKGGVHTELGFFLGRDLPIYLMGRRGNTFHYLPQVRIVNNPGHLITLIS